ncbi:ATP-binding cassette sub-family F member 3-like [Rhodamnia argentea]|uniref:ATP-binding cassette sub-family F member 3-like n=1 Tax=Rhodamnia argentea TaxID=178133 RepID=A0ABM3HK97_9MYRT|nr:ATP-binding cassette sub-family F member 3-like [Rhodamnia argentea]
MLPASCVCIINSDLCGKSFQFFKGVPEQKLRAHWGSFGLTGNLALQPMYTLFGGQKSRVAFAKITFKKPHIVFLDKPSNYLNQSVIIATGRRKMTDDWMACQAKTRLCSNHLDLDAVEALIQGLVFFQGGILMVSHDEHLQAWASSRWFLKARWHLSMGVSGIVRRYFSPRRVRESQKGRRERMAADTQNVFTLAAALVSLPICGSFQLKVVRM